MNTSLFFVLLFFFKQKTAYEMRISDWSSDVCSSDLFVARRASEVAEVLEAADKARRETGGTLAGYIAYEAGLALEQRLFPLANQCSGAMGQIGRASCRERVCQYV